MSGLALLATASLGLAAIHVLWSFILAGLMRMEARSLEAGREKVRVARVRQGEIDGRITAASSELDQLSVQLHQLQRQFESACDGKLRFEITHGRPAPGLAMYVGTIFAPATAARGRDALLWTYPVTALIWAVSPDRARTILRDTYAAMPGFRTDFSDNVPIIGPLEGGDTGRASF